MAISTIRLKSNHGAYIDVEEVYAFPDAKRNCKIREFSSRGEMICGCSKMRVMATQLRNDRLVFYTKSRTDAEHDVDCRYGTGRFTSQYESALRKNKDGTIDISVEIDREVGLRVNSSKCSPKSYNGLTKKVKGKASLLGFFEILWEAAEVNCYLGFPRNWLLITGQLGDCIEHVRVNGKLLNEVMPSPGSGVGASSGIKKGYMIRQINEILPSKYPVRGEAGFVLKLSGLGLPAYLSFNASELTELEDSYGGIRKMPSGSQAWAIIQFDKNGNTPNVKKVAWIVADMNGIPVESGFELEMSEALVVAKRKFRKPMRYDSECTEFHADFELLDYKVAGQLYIIEVWGMGGETDLGKAYTAHRSDKERVYNTKYGPSPDNWFGWDAYSKEVLNLDRMPKAK